MRQFFILILLLSLTVILQLTIVGRINVLSGSGDLVLVLICALASKEKVKYIWLYGVFGGAVMGVISAVPWYLPLIGYLAVIGLSKQINKKIWQAPLLSKFILIFFGSLFSYTLTYIYRVLFEKFTHNINEVFFNIILPSTLINIVLILLVNPLINVVGNITEREENSE